MPYGSSSSTTGVRLILEREVRFVPAARLPRTTVTTPRWRGYDVEPLAGERHVNTYFDTPTRALAGQGVTFRRRVYLDAALPSRAELTVKLPRAADSGPLFARPEYTEPIAAGEPLTGHPLLMLAAEYAADEPIAPWFSAHTDRAGVALRRDEARIDLTWDRLTLPDDPDYADDEIEAELVAGPVAALDALAGLLTGGYGLEYGDSGKRTRAARHLARLGVIAFDG